MSSSKTIREAFGLESHLEVQEVPLLYGAELEIEALQAFGKVDTSIWNITEDGSLRNSGRELISVPLTKEVLVEEFKKLHETIKYSSVEQAFSERTSIHIHINCLDVSEHLVKNIVLWYALYESVFFKFCDPAREHNIHCVCLHQTNLPAHYRRTLKDMFKQWSKYTALNMLPLAKYGTLEFRHLQGTNDVEVFSQWLKIIENLFSLGRSTILTEKIVSSEEEILKYFDVLFKDTIVYKQKPVFLQDIKNSIIDLKLSFV